MKRGKSILAVLPGLLLLIAGPVAAKDKVQQTFNVPAQFAATIQTSQCSSTPGPQVNLAGSLSIAPLNVDVIFSHLQQTPAQPSFAVTKTVIPANAPPTAVPQQAVVGTMSNNPFIWLQLTDAKGQALTSELFLGRCDQGQFNPMINLSLAADVAAQVAADSCDTSTGPVVSLDGQIATSPIQAKVIFRNSDQLGMGGMRPSESSVNVLIVPTGPTFLLPTDSAVASTGGNPIISTQFKLGDGTPVGIEQNLGRCSSIVVK